MAYFRLCKILEIAWKLLRKSEIEIYKLKFEKDASRIPVIREVWVIFFGLNPYPTAFPYGNGMVLHFYQQQESSTTKTVHRVINRGLKAYVYSPHTGENFFKV